MIRLELVCSFPLLYCPFNKSYFIKQFDSVNIGSLINLVHEKPFYVKVFHLNWTFQNNIQRQI